METFKIDKRNTSIRCESFGDLGFRKRGIGDEVLDNRLTIAKGSAGVVDLFLIDNTCFREEFC